MPFPFLFSECLSTPRGEYYRGKIAVTAGGKKCQAWAKNTPQSHYYRYNYYFTNTDASVEDASNYCRRPYTNYYTKPWCYIDDAKSTVPWDFCDIPVCSGK